MSISGASWVGSGRGALRSGRKRAAMRGLVLAGVATVAIAGCSSSVRPEVAVRCQPGSIDIDVHNVSDATARYTITVESDRSGIVETVMMSSNDVEPDQTVTLNEIRPDEPATCKVVDVKVFNQ